MSKYEQLPSVTVEWANAAPCWPHMLTMSPEECRQLAEDISLLKSGRLPHVEVEWLDEDDRAPTAPSGMPQNAV